MSFANFLEPRLCLARLVWVFIRVPNEREFAVSFLDVVAGGVAREAECFVVVLLLAHSSFANLDHLQLDLSSDSRLPRHYVRLRQLLTGTIPAV